MDNYYALILAGGGGTRLWPMSRKNTPKQLLPLVGDESMFTMSVRRLLPIFAPERIYIVTGRDYVDALRADAPEIPERNFIAEPYGRDSAAAAALAISVIHQRDPQAVVAILTADHHIAKPDEFLEVLQAAHDIARMDYIVTLGITPSFPATGFGYIQQGAKIDALRGFSYHHATRFTEKPDIVKATQFIASGRYSWNSGMFIWQTRQALAELERQQPMMHSLFARLQRSVDQPDFGAVLDEIWAEMPKISIDYAIMEHAERMAVIPVDIGWSDVGSWASLYDVLPLDRFGNSVKGAQAENRVILDTRNTLVISDKLTVAIGVEDVIVIDTPDALLLCHRERSQQVKEIVQYLNDNGLDQYL